jgi:hypothetical protein
MMGMDWCKDSFFLCFCTFARMKVPLNLPPFQPRLRITPKGEEIYDECRRKYVKLTPEEWVRQHFIRFMVSELGFPVTLIVVEAALQVHSLRRRFDILAYDTAGKPRLIVECKSPSVPITQAVFDQVAAYNVALKVEYLVVTNGLIHYSCLIDHLQGKIVFLENIPHFHQI